MPNARTDNKLPFSCGMLCLSLGGATVILLIAFSLSSIGLISTETAIWIAISAFVAAAIYESVLVFLMTRHMLDEVSKKPGSGR